MVGIDIKTAAFLFLILKLVAFAFLYFLIIKLFNRHKEKKNVLIKIQIGVYLSYSISFLASIFSSIVFVYPNIWIISSLYNEPLKQWFSLIGLVIGNFFILEFYLNLYYENIFTRRYKKGITVFFLVLNSIVSILSLLFPFNDNRFINMVSLVFLIGFIEYIVSLIGWYQIRFNISEENFDEKEKFDNMIKRLDKFGKGIISFIIGFSFVFMDFIIPKEIPNTFLSVIGWFFVTVGLYFYYNLY